MEILTPVFKTWMIVKYVVLDEENLIFLSEEEKVRESI